MSQFYTTASAEAAPAPREGLPPCIAGLAISPEGRIATWTLPCTDRTHLPHRAVKDAIAKGLIPVPRHLVQAGRTEIDGSTTTWHGRVVPKGTGGGATIWCPTGSKKKAATAWERAERWVRTGVLDEG